MEGDNLGRHVVAHAKGSLVAVIALGLVFTACGPIELGGKSNETGSDASAAGNPAEASGTLRELEIAPPGSMSGYSRERFPHWSDAAEFGWDVPFPSCDVRDAALIRDGEGVEVGDGCDIASGRWFDPYTGSTYDDPAEIDIDHVVPLAEAWRSGASFWDAGKRERYANDPDVLLAVEDNANQSKGDKGPEAWRPPREAVWCEYAARWIGIKSKYELSVDEREKDALDEMLGACREGS